MTGFALKLIAIITMTVDHIGAIFFPQYIVLRCIGRVSFPIFCFLMAEGFVHTRNFKRYLLRLIAFAVISYVPYSLTFYGSLFTVKSLNIYFELAAGLIALYFTRKAMEKSKLYAIVPALVCAAAEMLNFSYGLYGILMILGFYIFRENKLLMAVSVIGASLIYCLVISPVWIQMYAVIAIVPIWLYNGKKGMNMPKYFSYIYYPAHLGVIVFIERIMTHF